MIDVCSGVASGLTTSTGKAWHYGRIPADAVPPFGYVTVVAGSWLPTLDRIPETVQQVIQLTASGNTDEDANWLLDKARAYFDTLTLPLAVSLSVQISGVLPERPPGAPIEEGTLVSVSEDYRILIGARN